MLTSCAGPKLALAGGGVYDVPEEVAKDLLRAGYAEEAQEEKPKRKSTRTSKTTESTKAKSRKTR